MFRCPRLHLLLLICIFMSSCSLMPDRLKTAEQLMETAPDSSLHILQRLSYKELNAPSERALYGLLLFRALDANKLELKPDSLIDFSLKYYLDHTDNERLAICYFYKGRTCKHALRYENAMDCYLKALDGAQIKNDYWLLGKINSDMGDICNVQQDYKLAREKYKLAYGYFTRMKLQSLAFNSFLDIGRTYYAAKNYRNAHIIYSKAFKQAKDSLQQGSLLQSIAINYYAEQKYDSALHYFRKVIPYPYIGNNRAIRYYYLADLFSDLNQIDSAAYYASNSFHFEPDIRTQRECYRILSNVSFLKGNMSVMSGYMNKYIELGDSIREIDKQTKGSVLEELHHTAREIDQTKQQRWYLIGILLLITAIGLTVYLMKQKHAKQEKLLNEKEHLQQKTGIRKEFIYRNRRILFQRVQASKYKQAAERKNATIAEKEEMDKLLYNRILHLNNKEEFNREMDVLLNDLVSKLKSRYPALNQKEITWCCLYLLKIPANDVLMLLDYKAESLKKLKQRLAQKTNLSSTTELDIFLNGILSEE